MLDLHALAERVRLDVETYEVPPHDPQALGMPLPTEWFAKGLAEMRGLLVEPYLVDVVAAGGRVAIVAEEPGHAVLAYDPVAEEFALGALVDGRFGDWNVRGDAVGCFLAR